MNSKPSRKGRHSSEVWTFLLSQVKLDTLTASGTWSERDLQLLKVLQEQGCSVENAARMLEVSVSTLRRHLSRLQGQVLQNLKVPEQLGPLNVALHDFEQLLLLVLPDGTHPLLEHLMALKDSQRRHAIKQSHRDTAKKAASSSEAQQVNTLQAQVQQLHAEKLRLQKKIQSLQSENKQHQGVSPNSQQAASPDMQKRLLVALKERDEWKTKAQRAIKRLENRKEYDERIIKDRDRLWLLKHFQMRLTERFGVVVDDMDLLELDEAVRNLPVMARTQNGTPVKQITLEGKMVFVVVTPDRFGRLTATSAYTREMLRLQH